MHASPLPRQQDSLEQHRKWAIGNLIEKTSNQGIQLLGPPWAADYHAAKKHRHHPEHTGPFIAEYFTRALPLVCSLPVFVTLACLASRVRWGGHSCQPGYDLVKSLGHILRLWILLPIGIRTLGTSWLKTLAKSPGRNGLDSSHGPGKNKEPGKSHSHLPTWSDSFQSWKLFFICTSAQNSYSWHRFQCSEHYAKGYHQHLHGRCLPVEEDCMGQSYSLNTSWHLLIPVPTAERSTPHRNRLDCLWDGPKLQLLGEKERRQSRADWISLCRSSAESASSNWLLLRGLGAPRIENLSKAVFQSITTIFFRAIGEGSSAPCPSVWAFSIPIVLISCTGTTISGAHNRFWGSV